MDFLRHNLKSEEHTGQSGQDKNLFDKIGGKFLSQIQPSQVSPKPESLLGTSGDSLDYTSIPPPPTPMREDVNFIGKLSSVVGGDYCDVSVLVPPPTTKVEGLWEKFGNTLRHPSTPKSAPEPPKPEGLFGKIGEALGVKKPVHGPPKGEGLLEKINDGIEGKHEELAKPRILVGKIDQALGGGAVLEKNEGLAIDLFQERVLRQRLQDNESALEQLKDKGIADGIKHGFKYATGFDLPGTKH
ncbi:hypothetical protein BDZ94DRAFT_1168771 [Collybia nuda]|uniref:Uncharacterized protein n=1 Tax=Collybia nuda TaxID=64659 RepID=A0A9P5Y3M0_9AGAR|nr:hypothetical protein BDZ94DRAFT_1168771 [Collybia nuda]